jgi:hypothetical protein
MQPLLLQRAARAQAQGHKGTAACQLSARSRTSTLFERSGAVTQSERTLDREEYIVDGPDHGRFVCRGSRRLTISLAAIY